MKAIAASLLVEPRLRPGRPPSIAPLPTHKAVPDPAHLAEEDEGRFLYCRRCRQPITSSAWQLQMAGSHLHTFPNPAGIVFEIGCFLSAAGCRCHGSHTAEFSWFPGYTWCFALCGGCFTHLGWFYQAVDGPHFFGLILSQLSEGPAPARPT